MTKTLSSVPIVLLVSLAITSPAHAQDSKTKTLTSAMDQMAEQIADFFQGNGIRKTVVDVFKGPSDVGTGRRVTQALVEKLKELGIEKAGPLDGDDLHRVEGKFSFQPQSKVIAITAFLVDKNNVEVLRFRQRVSVQQVSSLADINALLPQAGVDFQEETKELLDEATDSKKNVAAKTVSTAIKLRNAQTDAIRDSIENKGEGFDLRGGTRLAGGPKSPFEIELLLERGNELRPVTLQTLGGGRFAFAPLAEGDVYRVKIRNTADHDVAVELNIDGVNTLSLSEQDAYRKHGRWVVRAGGTASVPGWHRGVTGDSINQYFKFEVTAEEKGVAREIGAPSDRIGTVQATFYHAWDPSREPTPAIEEAARIPGQTSLGLATGKGAQINVRTKQVRRMFGKQPLATVAIRYENPDLSDLPDDLPPTQASSSPSTPSSEAVGPAL